MTLTEVFLVVLGIAFVLLHLIAAVPDLAFKNPNSEDQIKKFGINVFEDNEFIRNRQRNDKTLVKNEVREPLATIAEKLWGKDEDKLREFKFFGRRFDGGIAGQVRLPLCGSLVKILDKIM